MVRDHRADPERLYAAGFSVGAMMAHEMACRNPGLFSAIAAVSGPLSLKVSKLCAKGKRARPVSVLMMHGSEDPFMGCKKKINTFLIWPTTRRLTIPATVLHWLRYDRCGTKPAAVMLPDRDPRDGTAVKRYSYGGCAEGRKVVHYEIIGGGHTWPGGRNTEPPLVVWRTSGDIDATSLIWDFFMEDAGRSTPAPKTVMPRKESGGPLPYAR